MSGLAGHSRWPPEQVGPDAKLRARSKFGGPEHIEGVQPAGAQRRGDQIDMDTECVIVREDVPAKRCPNRGAADDVAALGLLAPNRK